MFDAPRQIGQAGIIEECPYADCVFRRYAATNMNLAVGRTSSRSFCAFEEQHAQSAVAGGNDAFARQTQQ